MKHWALHLALGLAALLLAILIRTDALPQAARVAPEGWLVLFGLGALARARTAASKVWRYVDMVGAGLAAVWLGLLQVRPELAGLIPVPVETIGAYVTTTLGIYTAAPGAPLATGPEADTTPIEVGAAKIAPDLVERWGKRPGPPNLDESSPSLTDGEPPGGSAA